MRIIIQGGRLIDPANQVDALLDVYIAGGVLVSLGSAPDGFVADRIIDASRRIVCPGLVDLCARMREPGAEHKATIASETRAAVSGGVTTLCCPPDTDPIIDTPAVVELVHQRADQAGNARVVTVGALTQGLGGEHLSEMAALKQAGCVAVGNGQRPIANTLIMRRTLEYAATYDLTVFLNPEDVWLRDGGYVHDGPVAAQLGLPGISEASETAAVARDLVLIEQTGARGHFCRLSTGRAVRMVARAQYDGLPVTADVAAHQLFLTEQDISNFDSLCYVLPPLRSMRDRDALRTGLERGTLSAICSNHEPHEPDAKLAPFPATEPGISALETLLPLTLQLVDDGVLDLSKALACVTHKPARILGTSAGTLTVGERADLCVFDPNVKWVLDSETMVSRGHNTPFLGRQLQGRATCTIAGGNIVYEREA